MAGLAVVLVVLLLPRGIAFGPLADENARLKERLDGLEGRMDEVERALLRLRAYEAQLRSLTPDGDHGPVAVAPAGGHASAPGGVPVTAWADALAARADTFLALFSALEPSLADQLVKAEELAALERALPSVWPADGELTSPFGWRRSPFGTRWTFHSGLDVARKRGVPIRAAADGVVVAAGWDGGFGYAVTLDHGLGITTVYAHCQRLFVDEGDEVSAGDRIATMGSTGRSTGPHLHFELQFDGVPVNPADYLPPHGGG